MSFRSILPAAWVAGVVLTGLVAASVAWAQTEAAETALENSAPIPGVVNADKVYVRSGAGEDQYAVMFLNKEDKISVVGSKGDWLKILPPDGSYCLVAKAFVELRKDGTIGRVSSGDNIVKIGSTLNAFKGKALKSLPVGTDVSILGTQDEYLKIAPPEGTVLYVHKRFVDPGTDAVPMPPMPETAGGPTVPPTDVPPTANPSTKPTEVAAGSPTTNPSSSEFAFDQLEAQFKTASDLAIDKQPVNEMLSGYQKLLAEKKLPASMLQVCDYRVKGLTLRAGARADYAELQKKRVADAAANLPKEAERAELSERFQQNTLKSFAAVGTLRPSTLQVGAKPLYRLTDPATGRTVVYLMSDDAKVLALNGQFVGVTGAVVEDTTLKIKYVTPLVAETIDPARVIQGAIISGMTPPSMLGNGAGK